MSNYCLIKQQNAASNKGHDCKIVNARDKHGVPFATQPEPMKFWQEGAALAPE